MEIAIIGFGPWGLSVLERVVDRADEAGVAIRVHIVDPGAFGGGVYSIDQPDYLVLNNPCGQLSLSALTDQDRPYAVDFYQWVTGRGYRWVGNECRITTAGRRIEPSDYLPRRLLGEYLTWFLDTMVDAAPPDLEVVRHPTTAIDIVPVTGGREQVLLESGDSLTVDHVVLTSGHTFNKADPDELTGARFIRPYPVDYFETAISPGDHVGVSGMGLVAFDVLTALTIGRGGSFVTEGGECRYLPSGREPVIEFYSRSGIPPSAKSATGIDSTGDYRPAVCTPEALASITREADGARRQADFRLDLLPLLTAEMQVRFQTHRAFLRAGATAAERVRCNLARAWLTGHFDQAVGDLSGCGGDFDPTTYFSTEGWSKFEDADDYEQHVHAVMEEDLREALAPGGSPIKAGEEVTRILRDDIRSVVEFGGLSLESYLDFQSNFRSRIHATRRGSAANAHPAAVGGYGRRSGAHPTRAFTLGRPGLLRAHPSYLQPTGHTRRGFHRHDCPRSPRHAVALSKFVASPQSPLLHRSPDSAQLQRDRGGQCGHQRGFPPLRPSRSPATTHLCAGSVDRGHPIFHPLPSVAQESHPRSSRRPAVRRVGHLMMASCGRGAGQCTLA